jgi:hypothetical protein
MARVAFFIFGFSVLSGCGADASPSSSASALLKLDAGFDPTAAGCHAGPTGQACQVPGACTPLCKPGEYELTCHTPGPALSAVPSPEDVRCRVIPLPTPANMLLYCCPCAR